MSRYGIALLVAILCRPALAIAGCADGGSERPVQGGIGGTGKVPGTRPGDDGVGGTGFIGTITGFGSICVGDAEIAYDAATPVWIDGRTAQPSDLGVGQVVAVATTGGPEPRAREISIDHVVRGPVTGVDVAHARLRVIEQTVQLLPATRGDAGALADVRTFAADTYVRVSGMRRSDGVIVASRVERGVASDVVQLSGPFATSADRGPTVGGTPVDAAGLPAVARGDEVRVVGRWSDGAIHEAQVEVVPRVPFDGRVRQVAIEGYPRAAGTQLRIGSFALAVASPGARAALGGAGRVRIDGLVRDRRVVVERVVAVGDLPVRPPRPETPPSQSRPGDAPGTGSGPPGPGRPDGGHARGGDPSRPDRTRAEYRVRDGLYAGLFSDHRQSASATSGPRRELVPFVVPVFPHTHAEYAAVQAGTRDAIEMQVARWWPADAPPGP